MCYSAESSLKTSAVSAAAIIYLLSSGIPHFQWLGITLIGWCGMQFAEYLLWSTNPNKSCTTMNTMVTMTLIPLVLVMQPVGSMLGSLFVIPWAKSGHLRRQIISAFIIFNVFVVWYFHFFDIQRTCTIVTPGGHLNWNTTKYNTQDNLKPFYVFIYAVWAFIIGLPLLLYWDKSWIFMSLILIMPIFGFIYGLYTDSKASLWCYYTSYTSYIAAAALFAKQMGFTDALQW